MKRIAVAIATICISTSTFAGGKSYHSPAASPTAAITGAHSAAEAKSVAASLAASGPTSSEAGASVGNSRAFAIGAASAPSPAQCVVVLPELFGAVTIMADNRACQLGALSRGYIDVGAQGKAERVLDALAAELKVEVK